VPVPFLGITFPELIARWERALHAVPDERYILRVATLGFFDGAPQPHLLWQKELPIRIDEMVRWNEYATPDLGELEYHIGFERPVPLPGTLAVHGTAKLRWTQDGVRGDIPQADAQVLLREAAVRGQHGGDNDLVPGRVTFTDGAFTVGAGGQWQVDTITCAYLEPASHATIAWTIGDWQRALGATLDGLVKAGEVPMLNALKLVVAANFLPMTAHIDALTRMDVAGRASNLDFRSYFEEERRRARLFAGDIEALKLSPAAAFGEAAGQPATPSRTAFLLRLALTTEVPALREYAWEGLRGADLAPALARTVQRAIASGVVVPEWLAERVQGTPSRLMAFLSDATAKLVGLLLLVLTAMISAFAAVRWRGRSGGTGRRGVPVLQWACADELQCASARGRSAHGVARGRAQHRRDLARLLALRAWHVLVVAAPVVDRSGSVDRVRQPLARRHRLGSGGDAPALSWAAKATGARSRTIGRAQSDLTARTYLPLIFSNSSTFALAVAFHGSSSDAKRKFTSASLLLPASRCA
jgi:hypothetical protein